MTMRLLFSGNMAYLAGQRNTLEFETDESVNLGLNSDFSARTWIYVRKMCAFASLNKSIQSGRLKKQQTFYKSLTLFIIS